MNKQRKTSHILNVFQYDETTGAVTLPSSLSLATPDSADNSTKVATTAWIRAYVGSLSYATASSVTTAIANLVASAPTTLDTLNELATALGNDPNFATTITTSIGTKVPQSRTITINGTAYDLSADRAWTIASGVTSFNTRTGAIILSSADVTGALGFTPYNATNPSGYITGITSANVTTALGYTPYNSTNPSGYITGITSGMVTGALGYTPYNSTNPSGYITSSALTSYLPLAGGTMTASIVNNIDGAVILESNASENNNWLWKENAKTWGLFWFNRGTQSGQTIGSYTTIGAELMFMGGGSGIDMPTGWTGYTSGSKIAAMISNYTGYIYSASTVYAVTDMRTPVFRFTNSSNNAYLTGNSDWGFRVVNDSGYIQFGPANGSWSHIYSDKSFYFNQALYVNGTQVVTNSGTWSISVNGTANNITAYTINQSLGTGNSPSFAEAIFGTTGGATNQGIQIRYQNYVSGYGRIRFYQSDSNHATIHVFSSSWQNGTLAGSSTGAINLDSGTGVTFGAWNNPDAYVVTGGQTYARGYRGIGNVAGTGEATYHPAGIYSTGTNWLYGTMYLNGNTIRDTSGIYNNEWFRNNNSLTGLYNQTNGNHFYSRAGSEWSITGAGANVGLVFRSNHESTIRGYIYGDTSNNFGFLGTDGNWAIRVTQGDKRTYLHEHLVVGYGQGSSNIWMSDSDETTRRIHCNSNRIGFLNSSDGWGAWSNNNGSWESANQFYSPRGLSNSADVSADNKFGLWFNGVDTDSYAIFREAGVWGWPYPDLRIAFHTGIKMGANSGYGGMKFYSDWDMATIVASINDGDNHMRGYYDIIAYASDKRLKHKIKVIDNALDKVVSLTGMTYEWNSIGKQHGWEPGTEREVGVFAQDVQAVLPEAVKPAPFDHAHDVDGNTYSKSGQNFLTVKYEKLVPLLIEAVKEQQAQITEQKAQIDELVAIVKTMKGF